MRGFVSIQHGNNNFISFVSLTCPLFFFSFFVFTDIDTKGKSDVQYGPTYITLMEKPVETVLDKNGDSERIAERRIRDTEKRRPKPVSQEITQPGGSFLHRVRDDAQVDVCVRASMAGAERPMRFHIRVEDLGDEVPHDETMEKDSLGADHHWSFLETQMDRMEHEMHAIISEADYFKERDAIYHQQTDDMHKATTFWPILHIFILLVTGFTQANHIVQFFKSRRII